MFRLPASATLALAALSTLLSGAVGPPARRAAPPANGPAAALGQMPLRFEPNVGQADPKVDFLSRGGGFVLGLSSTEAVLTVAAGGTSSRAKGARKPAVEAPAAAPQEASVVRMRLVGANQRVPSVGHAPLPGRVNYFLGNDPRRWRRDIPTYGRVRYAEVYPGVDLVYYGSGQRLEYDFVVAPGAHPEAIRLAYPGANPPELDASGDLVLATPAGPVRQHRPVLYQEVGGVRKPVRGEYALNQDGTVGFALGDYDASQPLVIDPVLSYASFLGGSSDEFGSAGALGADGSYYVTGYTQSLNLPTVNPLQPTNHGVYEAFIAKIDPLGSQVVYCTYFGGWGTDLGSGIDVDSAGNAYVTGNTTSANLPVVHAFQNVLRGDEDAFVLKLNVAGNDLEYSSYLGGNEDDRGQRVAVDGQGNACVVGSTYSLDFPVQQPFYEPLSASLNAFVTKIAPSGDALVYSSLLGGSAEELPRSVAVDAAGSAYVVGLSNSEDFLSVNPLPFNDAGFGGFLTKVGSSGAVQYSGRVGGIYNDDVLDVAVDAAGQACLVGETTSPDLATENALQPVSGGIWDGFLIRVSAAGNQVLSSTYLGGAANDTAMSVALDGEGNIGIAGMTESANFPTLQAIQAQNGGGARWDAYVTLLNPTGTTLLYSTYLGGAGQERAESLSLDENGNAYLCGWTDSLNFPVSAPFQPTYGGGLRDAFVARIAIIPPPTAPTSLTAGALSQTEIGLSWVDTSSNEAAFQIERKAGDASANTAFVRVQEVVANQTSVLDSGLLPATTYTYRVRAVNRGGPSAYRLTTATTLPPPPAAPSGLAVTVVSQSRLDLQWTDESDNETQFEIERLQGMGEYQVVAQVGAGVTTFSDVGLAAATFYIYRVRAVNSGGASAYTAGTAAVTLPYPPAAPSALQVTAVSATQLRADWSDHSDNEQGFEIELRKPDGSYQLTAAVGVDQTSVLLGGARGNGTRTYRMRAVNAGGASDYSNVASGLTFPEAPTSVTLSRLSQSRLDLHWNDPNEAPVAVQIERRTAAGEFDFTTTVAAGSKTYADFGLAAGTEYTYRLRGINATGVSTGFQEVTGRTLLAPPVAPSALAVTAGTSTQLNLHWTDQSANESQFEVYRQVAGGALMLVGLPGANAVSFVDPNCQPNTTYTYRVRAVNEGGASGYTPAQSGLTRPASPTNLVLQALTKRRVDVRWTNQNATPAAHRVERQTGEGGYVSLATVAAGTNAFIDTTATPGAVHSYRVWATNASGDSPGFVEAPFLVAGGKLQFPATVNFGKARVGASTTRTVTLKNGSRTEALRVAVGVPSAPYQLTARGGIVTLAPGAKHVLTLVFRPTAPGQAKRTLEITSSDPAKALVRVKLTGAGK